MKKLLFALLLYMVLLSGCGSAESSESSSQRSVDDVYWAVPMTASKYKSYFDETPAQIIDRINAQSDGHFDELYQLQDDNDRMWTQNGIYWAICFTLDTPDLNDTSVKRPYKVELDLSACDDETTAGYMIEALIGAFVPEEVDNVTFWLDIYLENDDIDDSLETLIGDYGYLSFKYKRGESLTISANGPLLVEDESTFTPVKPE